MMSVGLVSITIPLYSAFGAPATGNSFLMPGWNQNCQGILEIAGIRGLDRNCLEN